MRNLGKAFTILARATVRENILHEDVSAFHAPSECHTLVSRGEAERLRLARRHAKSVSGLNARMMDREWRRLHPRHIARLEVSLYNDLSPYC